MILTILQIISFLAWNIITMLILYFRIKKPYKTFRKTHVWGKIEKFNFVTYNSYIFASIGLLLVIVYALFTKTDEFSSWVAITITSILVFVHLLTIVFYTAEIYIFIKVRQNPLWLYKDKTK